MVDQARVLSERRLCASRVRGVLNAWRMPVTWMQRDGTDELNRLLVDVLT
jgi:hypothetical protein